MREIEQTVCDLWNDMSYRRYNKNNRKHAYEKDVFEIEKENIKYAEININSLMDETTYPIGIYEDITLSNCSAIEDLNRINTEFN